MIPTLPAELVEQIIDVLADDPLTLRACRLTSKTWLPRSHVHLFHSTTLEHQSCLTTERLLSMINTTPQIANLISTLTVINFTLHDLATLPHLPRLDVLVLAGFISPQPGTQSTPDPLDILHRMEHNLSSVRTLSFRTPEFLFVEDIFLLSLALQNIRTLELLDCLRKAPPHPCHILHNFKIQVLSLRALVVRNVAAVNFVLLMQLLATRKFEDIAAVECLEFEEPRDFDRQNGVFDIPLAAFVQHNNALHDLRVSVSSLEVIEQLIQGLPNANTLHKVEFCLMGYNYGPYAIHGYTLLIRAARGLSLSPDAELRLSQELHYSQVDFEDRDEWRVACDEIKREPMRCACTLVIKLIGWEGTDASEVPVPDCVRSVQVELARHGVSVLFQLGTWKGEHPLS